MDMTSAPATPALRTILRDLTRTIGTRQKVLLGELVEALVEHGYGPVILLAAAMMILPIGMIPGVPAFMGIVLLLTGVQMLRGKHSLWLPPRLYGITLPGPLLLRAIRRVLPFTLRIESRLRPRLSFLIDWRLSCWAMALILILTAILLIVIGAVPGLPFLLALHVLTFGLGLTTRDGLFVAAGYAILLPVALVVWYLTHLV